VRAEGAGAGLLAGRYGSADLTDAEIGRLHAEHVVAGPEAITA